MRKQTSKRQSKPRNQSKGLGDIVEDITTATGIKAAVDWFSEQTGIDCGCDKRKEMLNRLMPGRKPECLTADEYEFIKFIDQRSEVNRDEQIKLNETYKRIFRENVQPTKCRTCINSRIAALMTVAKAYEQTQSDAY